MTSSGMELHNKTADLEGSQPHLATPKLPPSYLNHISNNPITASKNLQDGQCNQKRAP
jgi:hypothetical protein